MHKGPLQSTHVPTCMSSVDMSCGLMSCSNPIKNACAEKAFSERNCVYHHYYRALLFFPLEQQCVCAVVCHVSVHMCESMCASVYLLCLCSCVCLYVCLYVRVYHVCICDVCL